MLSLATSIPPVLRFNTRDAKRQIARVQPRGGVSKMRLAGMVPSEIRVLSNMMGAQKPAAVGSYQDACRTLHTHHALLVGKAVFGGQGRPGRWPAIAEPP